MMPMVGANPPADSKTLGMFSSILGLIVQLQLHHLAQLLRFGAVDRQHE